MPREPMILTTTDIKNTMLHPELIKYIHGVDISDQWGQVNGRQLIIDVYRLCEEHEELLKELEFYKNKE